MIMAFFEKYWEAILIILVIIAISLGIRSCGKPANTNPIVTETKWTAPDKQDVKNYNAKEVIKVDLPKDIPVGKKPEVKIIKTNDDKLLQVIEFKTDYGFSNKVGVWGGASLVSLTGGIKYSPVFYSRVYLDLLAGWPESGGGISYQVMKNSFIGIGYAYDFKIFTPLPILYASLNF